MAGPEPDFDADDDAPHASLDGIGGLRFTRRRSAALVAGFVVIWLVGVFANQASDAAAAASQADALQARNAALQQDIDSLQAELQLIQQPGFVSSAAHGYMLGLPGEIPFTIDGSVPAPAANAPGSVGIARQNVASPDSPLDAWLAALFGGR
jgi:cell division protein FtsB